MNQELASMTDMTALKAMAYDAIAAKEEAERHLGAINNRIRQVMANANVTAAPSAPAVPAAGAADGGSVDETTPPAAGGSDGADEPTPGQ